MKSIATVLSIAGLLFIFPASAQQFDKFGKGITFTAADSSGSVKLSARIQNLIVVDQNMNFDRDPAVNAMTRRARLKFDGFAFSSKLKYKIELGLSNRDISSSSEANLGSGSPRIIYDAVLKYEFLPKTFLWFGQTKLPGNRERVISSQKLQFVDRSLVNTEFNLDRDFGFQLRHSFKIGNMVVREIAAISMGEGRNITAANNGGYDYTGRLEFLPFGSFTGGGDYYGSDLAREPKPKLSIGISGDYNEGSIRQAGQLGRLLYDTVGNFVENNVTTFLADMMFKYKGFSSMAEAAYRVAEDKDVRDAFGRAYAQGFGYSIQGGYLFQTNYELAFRYTRISKISGYVSSLNNVQQYTVGLSKYIIGHNLKVQTDLTYEQEYRSTFVESLIFRLQTELSF